MKKLILLTVAAIAAGCGAMGTKSVDPATAAAVAARLESRDYTVRFDMIEPSRGPAHTLTNEWNIRVVGDGIHSYLPYVGEAYTPVIGRQEGLNFDGKISGYTMKKGKKGESVITFGTSTIEDRYEYRLTVWPDGGATLGVYPDLKSSVSFDGRLDLKEKPDDRE